MAKTDLTIQIEKALVNKYFLKKSLRYGLEVSTIDSKFLKHNTVYWNKRVDFIAYDKKDNFIFVEIKISKSDFKSKNGHNFNGNQNYYAMPEELYDNVKNLIPDNIGVITYKNYELKTMKKCKKIESMLEISNKIKINYNAIEKQKYNIITACNSTIRRLLEKEYN